MSDDNIAATSATPSEPAATTTSTDTLESIAQGITVDDQAQQFQATPTAPHAAPSAMPNFQAQPTYQPNIPDPVIDPNGYRAYMTSQTQIAGQIQGTLKTLEQRLVAYEQQQTAVKVEADIKSAVTKVNEKLKIDPLSAEIALERTYRTDQNFKRIWDNRAKNPQALEKALDVISQKLAPSFQVRQDPQLTENQRAAKASQRTMASTAKGDYDPRMKGLYDPDSQADFDRTWDAFKRGLIPS